MDKKIYRILKGYSKLDYSQRKEFREKIKEYEESELDKRKSLLEAIQKSLGPVSQDVCDCCGK